MRKRRAISPFETPSAIICSLCARRTSAPSLTGGGSALRRGVNSGRPLREAATIDIAAVSRGGATPAPWGAAASAGLHR